MHVSASRLSVAAAAARPPIEDPRTVYIGEYVNVRIDVLSDSTMVFFVDLLCR